MRVDISRVANLTAADREGLRALTAAVYPPEAAVSSPNTPIVWAPAEWSVRIRDEEGALVSHIGLLSRAVLVDDVPVVIGGIGGVKTHPAARNKGFASAGLTEAVRFFTDEVRVAFALLVCLPPLVPYYARHGWQRFHGTLLVEQPGGIIPFTANLPMVLPIQAPVPTSGVIDLCGEPW